MILLLVGLGLTICKRIADLMHGTLWCESELGRGSTFHLSIPCCPARNIYYEGDCEAAPGVPPVEHAAGVRLLLVEDNEINQEIAKAMLRHLGFSCDLAQNGREAVKMAAETRYDLILMDVYMPVQDGLSATREIRGHMLQCNDLRPLPIIAMTAVSLPEIVDEIIGASPLPCTKPTWTNMTSPPKPWHASWAWSPAACSRPWWPGATEPASSWPVFPPGRN